MNKKILLVLLVLIVLIVSVFIWVFEREPQDKSDEIETKYTSFKEETDDYIIEVVRVNEDRLGAKIVNGIINDKLLEFKEIVEKDVSGIRDSKFDFPYYLEISIEDYQTDKYLFYLLNYSEYTGGANTNQYVRSIGLDKANGDIIKLSDVVDEYLLMEKLRTELLAMEEDMYVFSGVSEEISFSDLNNFYIDGNNLVLVFSKYEIVPGTAGIIRIEFDISTVEPDNKQTIIDFSSHPDALKFKTNLIEGVKGGPNFAEHYTIISWGCGTMCQVVAIVDNRDGAVYFPITSTLGVDFRIDSNLLIVDPSWKIQENFGEYEIPDWAHPRYYIWENNSLIEI